MSGLVMEYVPIAARNIMPTLMWKDESWPPTPKIDGWLMTPPILGWNRKKTLYRPTVFSSRDVTSGERLNPSASCCRYWRSAGVSTSMASREAA